MDGAVFAVTSDGVWVSVCLFILAWAVPAGWAGGWATGGSGGADRGRLVVLCIAGGEGVLCKDAEPVVVPQFDPSLRLILRVHGFA